MHDMGMGRQMLMALRISIMYEWFSALLGYMVRDFGMGGMGNVADGLGLLLLMMLRTYFSGLMC
jgi:hypothetical protein